MSNTAKVNPKTLHMWATRKRCWMCRHQFSEPVLLPAENPERGKFQPNISVEALWHLKDTHGIPPETTREWIVGSVYDMELGLFGVKGIPHDGTE